MRRTKQYAAPLDTLPIVHVLVVQSSVEQYEQREHGQLTRRRQVVQHVNQQVVQRTSTTATSRTATGLVTACRVSEVGGEEGEERKKAMRSSGPCEGEEEEEEAERINFVVVAYDTQQRYQR